MTQYDAAQVAQLWIANGGDPAAEVAAVAIATAESALNSAAVGGGGYGLWQAQAAYHFGDGVIGWNNWTDPNVQAREAIKVSVNGRNWAAWCTAWDDPDRDCGHGTLASPQAASPAGQLMAATASAINSQTLAPNPPAATSNRDQAAGAWSDLVNILTGHFPLYELNLGMSDNLIRSL